MVSIIVPVYNVELYLHRCVDSVLHQRYADFELILVDDGSKDSSGRICDDYVKIDPRVVVIHKENGGASSARNAGLSIAKGEYLSFVDSDDWIDEDFLASLIPLLSNDVGIAACGMYMEYPYQTIEVCNGKGCTITSLNLLESGDINRDWFGNYFCNKIFLRNLFNGLFFPEGRVYEDISLLYKILLQTPKVGILGKCAYHYYKGNAGAISRNLLMESRYDFVLAHENRWHDLIDLNLGIDLSELACSALASIPYLCMSTDLKCNQMYDEAVKFANELKAYKPKLKFNKRVMLYMCLHCPMLFNRLVTVARKILHR